MSEWHYPNPELDPSIKDVEITDDKDPNIVYVFTVSDRGVSVAKVNLLDKNGVTPMAYGSWE